MDNAVGVLGGLGPMATIYFCELVLSMTRAERDQDHVNMIILNHAAIPDRTAYILKESGESPLPFMIDDALRLETAGAKFIVIPCNTAHYFIDEVKKNVSVPVLDIVRETVKEAKRRFPGMKRLGVLATDGTIITNTYKRACEEEGVEYAVPDESVQKEVMSLIYDKIKAGEKPEARELERLIDHMREKGCRCTVLGCTELSVAKRDCGISDGDVVDSLEVLAMRTIERAGKEIRIKS
ncbi:MAG: amino acid racemase [Clostridiales bacterium]|nr:amino acid racemase [Clostridiales bacterium]